MYGSKQFKYIQRHQKTGNSVKNKDKNSKIWIEGKVLMGSGDSVSLNTAGLFEQLQNSGSCH